MIFRLGDEQFGICIFKVRELVGMLDITRVPHAHHCIQGVINLRGKMIPVLDLKARLGISATVATGQTAIVIVQRSSARGEQSIGLLVDEMLEVRAVQRDDLQAPANFPSHIDQSFLHAIRRLDERVILLLDIDRVLDDPERVLFSGLDETPLRAWNKHSSS
jgi:purine-binding chemotaxis protein CheW